MIRMLQDLTGIDRLKDIPWIRRRVSESLPNTEALGVTPEDLGGCKLPQALGIPEFGTDFAMQMLIEPNRNIFRIWCGFPVCPRYGCMVRKRERPILSGQATIQTAICCRDDIMIYLIQKGLEEGLSFTIMESVRKGKD